MQTGLSKTSGEGGGGGAQPNTKKTSELQSVLATSVNSTFYRHHLIDARNKTRETGKDWEENQNNVHRILI